MSSAGADVPLIRGLGNGPECQGRFSEDNTPFALIGALTLSAKAMTTRRTTTQPLAASGPKLRQTQAEYTAARPNAEPGVKPMMSSSKMYVCIKCHANFKTGDGKPDPRLRGLGRCNNCLGVAAAAAAATTPASPSPSAAT
jgi:DNA-directed RNA polymerase subunit RPC12/RpoP